jgi:hypothetical protein
MKHKMKMIKSLAEDTTLNQILPIIRNHANKKWILIHITDIHDAKDIIELQNKFRNEGLDMTFVHDRKC